jgi:putative ABC transport system permease protein
LKLFLKLIRFIVWRNIKAEKFLSLLSVIGVALGIGLFIGIKVSSDRAIASFEADVKGADPSVNYEILAASGVDFDEAIYGSVRRVDDKSFPVLKVNAYLPKKKETLEINGIDSVRAAGQLRPSASNKQDLEGYYRTIGGVVITRKFADAYSLRKGDVLDAQVYDRSYALKVMDILDGGPLPSRTAIMDIGNFQEYFGKAGYLSEIGVQADEKMAEKIRRILPPGLTIERRAQVIGSRKALITSFRYNLQFISVIAILVGIFLLYNTVFISVIKRRTEIGILRGLGADRKTVVVLFMIQGIILGFVGSLLGIVLGQGVAYFAVGAVQKTITTMYRAISISDYFITRGDALAAVALGLLVSLVASVIPSFESSRIRPNESAKEGTFEGKYKGYYGLFAVIGLLGIVSGSVIAYLDYRLTPFDFPFLAYAGILLIILGFALVSPYYLSWVLRVIRRPAKKLFPVTGEIATGDMRGNIYRFSVALMSVAISGALIISLLTLIFSFKSSLREWIGKNISADIYVKASSCKSNFCFFPLSEEVIDTIRSLPEVGAVDKFRTLYIDFYGKKIVAGFGDVRLRGRYLREKFHKGNGEERYREPALGRKVAISGYLGIKYGLRKGDIVEIATPKGVKTFTVSDIFSSYSTTSGFIYLDRRWLREYWGLDDATQLGVYLKEGVDVDRFIQKVKERLVPRYSLDIMNTRELRESVMGTFDKTFAITYAIELISIVVSLIGVINTLLALVLEKKREISIIRYLGGSWQQIRQTLVFASGIVGITGILLGAAMGLIMSVIFVNVINKISFGWEIHFSIPAGYLAIVAVLLFLTTLFAGLIPSKVARKIDPKRFISFE